MEGYTPREPPIPEGKELSFLKLLNVEYQMPQLEKLNTELSCPKDPPIKLIGSEGGFLKKSEN